MESFGEDPYVNGIMGKAMVDGYQQKDDTGIAACLKHFAGYGAVNAGREYNDVEISRRTFLEQYVKPFRMALKAKPAMVMTAFNAIDRKPISGNKELLKGLLRDKEGFEGTVISDWGSIGQLEEQGVAANMEEAAIQASEAGVDIDMMSPAYMLCLGKLVESGKIPEAFVDESAFRVLMMKNRPGDAFGRLTQGVGASINNRLFFQDYLLPNPHSTNKRLMLVFEILPMTCSSFLSSSSLVMTLTTGRQSISYSFKRWAATMAFLPNYTMLSVRGTA